MPILPTKIPENLRRIIRPAAVVFGVILIFLIFNSFAVTSGVNNETQGLFFRVGSGIQKTYKKVFSSKTEIIEEGNHFKFLATSRSIDEAKLFEYERKVLELQDLLEYRTSSPYRSTTANIIARSVAGESSMLVDQGSEEGIREGLPVVAGDGFIVGVVVSVKPHRSTVRLLRDSSSSIPSAILNEKKIVGLVNGLDSFLMLMDFIPQNEIIDEQNIVVTSGLDKDIPSGLVIGVIDSLIENETASFKQAYIDPIVDVNDYTSVLILDPLAAPYGE